MLMHALTAEQVHPALSNDCECVQLVFLFFIYPNFRLPIYIWVGSGTQEIPNINHWIENQAFLLLRRERHYSILRSY